MKKNKTLQIECPTYISVQSITTNGSTTAITYPAKRLNAEVYNCENPDLIVLVRAFAGVGCKTIGVHNQQKLLIDIQNRKLYTKISRSIKDGRLVEHCQDISEHYDKLPSFTPRLSPYD